MIKDVALPHMVAAQHQQALVPVPEREGEIAQQMLRAAAAPHFIGAMQQKHALVRAGSFAAASIDDPSAAPSSRRDCPARKSATSVTCRSFRGWLSNRSSRVCPQRGHGPAPPRHVLPCAGPVARAVRHGLEHAFDVAFRRLRAAKPQYPANRAHAAVRPMLAQCASQRRRRLRHCAAKSRTLVN